MYKRQVVPLIVLLCIFPEWILRIYTNDSILIESCTASIYVMTIYYMLALPGNLLFQSVSGTGDTRTAFLIEMATIVFYTLAIYVIIVGNGRIQPEPPQQTAPALYFYKSSIADFRTAWLFSLS